MKDPLNRPANDPIIIGIIGTIEFLIACLTTACWYVSPFVFANCKNSEVKTSDNSALRSLVNPAIAGRPAAITGII